MKKTFILVLLLTPNFSSHCEDEKANKKTLYQRIKNTALVAATVGLCVAGRKSIVRVWSKHGWVTRDQLRVVQRNINTHTTTKVGSARNEINAHTTAKMKALEENILAKQAGNQAEILARLERMEKMSGSRHKTTQTLIGGTWADLREKLGGWMPVSRSRIGR